VCPRWWRTAPDSQHPRLPLRVAVELLSARVAQLSHYMSENGLQPPSMPPGKSAALEKVFTSLGLHDVFREMSVEIPDSSRTTGSTAQSAPGGDSVTRQSPVGDPTAFPEIAAEDLSRQEDSYNYEGFGEDLRLWNSQADTEITCNTSGPKGPSPYDLDTSPFGEVPGPYADAMPSSRSRVSYEGPSIFDEENASQSNGSNESLVDELSHRVGTLTIGPAGRTKLRGASLMFNVEKAKDSVSPGGNSDFAGSAHVMPAQAGAGPDVPEELLEHLVNRYFDWENPFSDIVDREIYMLAKARRRSGEGTPYFSQALCDAM